VARSYSRSGIMGAALAATARMRRERIAEKRMVVENEDVRRGERRGWDLPEMPRKGHPHLTFIPFGASAVVKHEAAATSENLHRFPMGMQINELQFPGAVREQILIEACMPRLPDDLRRLSASFTHQLCMPV
jgi:hypothetical protein